MKKAFIIKFAVLAVLAAAGAAAVAGDLARLRHGGGNAENREYKIISVEISDVTGPQPSDAADEEAAPAGAKEAYVYLLGAERGYIVIFRGDGSFYDYTDISLYSLPKDVQIEVLNTKKLTSRQELYDFLETYST
ncbi:MAG: hypothetical protein NC223_10930 [Butyrivibrio sp.]|nr:hypothetical protein [Butyrivibrio sp.]